MANLLALFAGVAVRVLRCQGQQGQDLIPAQVRDRRSDRMQRVGGGAQALQERLQPLDLVIKPQPGLALHRRRHGPLALTLGTRWLGRCGPYWGLGRQHERHGAECSEIQIQRELLERQYPQVMQAAQHPVEGRQGYHRTDRFTTGGMQQLGSQQALAAGMPPMSTDIEN